MYRYRSPPSYPQLAERWASTTGQHGNNRERWAAAQDQQSSGDLNLRLIQIKVFSLFCICVLLCDCESVMFWNRWRMQVCIPVLLVAQQERMVETTGCVYSVSQTYIYFFFLSLFSQVKKSTLLIIYYFRALILYFKG